MSVSSLQMDQAEGSKLQQMAAELPWLSGGDDGKLSEPFYESCALKCFSTLKSLFCYT